jgi:hypothetical protein
MQTGIRILKIVGKAAASVIVWVAGKLERRN